MVKTLQERETPKEDVAAALSKGYKGYVPIIGYLRSWILELSEGKVRREDPKRNRS